jgi:hypothetical protein
MLLLKCTFYFDLQSKMSFYLFIFWADELWNGEMNSGDGLQSSFKFWSWWFHQWFVRGKYWTSFEMKQTREDREGAMARPQFFIFRQCWRKITYEFIITCIVCLCSKLSHAIQVELGTIYQILDLHLDLSHFINLPRLLSFNQTIRLSQWTT